MGLDILTERIDTVGQLVEAVGYLEYTKPVNSSSTAERPSDEECRRTGIVYWYRLNDVVLRSPGVADVKMLCEARGGWTCVELRRQRGIVGDSCGLSAASIDAMPVVEFAQLLTPRKQAATENKKTTNKSARGGRKKTEPVAKAEKLIAKGVARSVIAEKTGLSVNHISTLKSQRKRKPQNEKPNKT